MAEENKNDLENLGYSATPNDSDLRNALKARNYADLTMPTPGDTSGVLGYAAGEISKSDALDLLQNQEFIQDVYDFFLERDGITFSSPQEAVEEFYSDRGWKAMNVTSMAKEAIYTTAGSATDAQKARLARLERVYDALPNFYEHGGTGMEGLAANVGKALFDSVNLIGFGVGGAYAKGGALAARAAGKSMLGGAIKEGAKKGALVEAGLGAGIEGAYNASEQYRDIGIGAQDEFSRTRLAGSVLILSLIHI